MSSTSDTVVTNGSKRFIVYSVTQLAAELRGLIASSPLRNALVEGEISGWKVAASGHAYFSLKDDGAVLPCAMFVGALGACDCRAALQDGVKVQAYGRVDVYPQRGNYQLVVQRMRLAGVGDLMVKFNELKTKLAREGVFEQHKRQIPFLPHRIGIVTSPTGAVIRDMLSVLGRRFPNVEVRLYPARVQGEGAAQEILTGLNYFNEVAPATGFEADVLIVGRGGGSIEDLWEFNDETLVRAVAASRIPVISAVGHETDFTLCDFAADLRAGTPSIAAEKAVPEKRELETKLASLAVRLKNSVDYRVQNADQHLDSMTLQLGTSLKTAAMARTSQLDALRGRLVPALRLWQQVKSAEYAGLAARLAPAARYNLEKIAIKLERQSEKLKLLSPYAVLERGYSLTTAADGRIVRDAAQVQSGERLKTRLAVGEIESTAI